MFMSAWKFVDSWIALGIDPGIEAGSDPQHKCLHEIPDGFKKYETGKTAFPGPHSHTSDQDLMHEYDNEAEGKHRR